MLIKNHIRKFAKKFMNKKYIYLAYENQQLQYIQPINYTTHPLKSAENARIKPTKNTCHLSTQKHAFGTLLTH